MASVLGRLSHSLLGHSLLGNLVKCCEEPHVAGDQAVNNRVSGRGSGSPPDPSHQMKPQSWPVV